MTFQELQKNVHAVYGPGLALRAVFPREQRDKVRTLGMIAMAITFMLAMTMYAFLTVPIFLPFTAQFSIIAPRVFGAFLIVFCVMFVLQAIEAFHRSYYFKGLAQVLEHTPIEQGRVPITWEVAVIVSDTSLGDITKGFLLSSYGQEVLYRAGVRSDVFETFLSERHTTLLATSFALVDEASVTLSTYLRSILVADREFTTFLAKHDISIDDAVHSADWVSAIVHKERLLARWWSRDNLGRIPGLGKNWSYGETYLLERYGHDLVNDPTWNAGIMRGRFEDDEVEGMEQVLARARQSNVLLVGGDLTAVRESVVNFYRKIRSGHILPPLEAKRVFSIDFEKVVPHAQDKAMFEEVCTNILTQAVNAGNIILYLEQFVPNMLSVRALGVDLVEVLTPYFESKHIQLIIASDVEGLHKHLEKDARLMEMFDVVHTHEVSDHALMEILEQRAYARERESGVLFSVPALRTIARLADRYFPSGVMPDKAFDLLEELIPMSLSHGVTQVLKADVEHLVYEKTGVPMGDPTAEERKKLLSLEAFLHGRVVGQAEAVTAVARALRRARAGVGSATKPMGTFLFLGPTGVGKTETAKALAEALFGDEQMMNRLDMSEFQSIDAVEQLIGSFDTGAPGRLSSMLRERQYGVLLLDEFEKSDRSVHDLFLQILDEGQFTDGSGKRVNARNLIIIATSNAGADKIWEWEKRGENLVAQKRILIDHLVAHGLYRPELLNRFDDIVLFHPLDLKEVREIARIHLTNLAKMLAEERNITLEISEELIDTVVKKGYDPQFGGRPLVRAIKEEVEQVVADRLLAGTLGAGDTLSYTDDN